MQFGTQVCPNCHPLSFVSHLTHLPFRGPTNSILITGFFLNSFHNLNSLASFFATELLTDSWRIAETKYFTVDRDDPHLCLSWLSDQKAQVGATSRSPQFEYIPWDFFYKDRKRLKVTSIGMPWGVKKFKIRDEHFVPANFNWKTILSLLRNTRRMIVGKRCFHLSNGSACFSSKSQFEILTFNLIPKLNINVGGKHVTILVIRL